MLKTNRSLLVYIILSICTFGIYHLFFVASATRDANIICRGDGRHTPGVFVYMILCLFTCGLYHLVWIYLVAERLSEACVDYKLPYCERGLTLVLWHVIGSLIFIGPLVSIYLLMKNLNELSMAFNIQRAAHV